MKDPIKVKQGKKNRQSGAAFELKVRKNLSEKGWIVIKNPNNLFDGEFKQGKSKYNPFTKRLMMNSGGFPDFLAFKVISDILVSTPTKYGIINHLYEVIGVEVKSNGYLDKEEKEKCKWLLENNIFSKILIAYKDYPEENIKLPPSKRKKMQICYKEFER
jgi:hypothetical protein